MFGSIGLLVLMRMNINNITFFFQKFFKNLLEYLYLEKTCLHRLHCKNSILRIVGIKLSFFNCKLYNI